MIENKHVDTIKSDNMATFQYAQSRSRSTQGISRHAQRHLFLLVLFVTDVLMLGAAFLVAYWLRFQLGVSLVVGEPSISFYQQLALTAVLPWIIGFYFFKLYDPNYLFGGLQEYGRIVQVNAFMVMSMVGLSFFVETFVISRSWILLSFITTTVFVLLERFTMRRIAYRLRRRGYMRITTLVVGADAEGRAIANQLKEAPTCGADVVGFLDDSLPAGEQIDGWYVLGPISCIQQIVSRLGVEEVLISLSALARPQLLGIYEIYGQSEAVTLRFSPGVLELFTTGAYVKEWGTVPLVSINKVRLSDMETLVKRCVDLIFSICVLAVLSPLLILIAILIAMDSPGPVFYRRYVLGQGGHPFDALKFRTMYVDGNDILDAFPGLREELQVNQKLKNDPRVTTIGRFLRKYSLDELPQLFNVLAGQMSLVGPRMITRPEQANYGKMRMNLLTVKPGLTGMWQISGRSDLSYEERVRMDMNYIRNYSIWVDLMIILRTIPAVLHGRGAY